MKTILKKCLSVLILAATLLTLPAVAFSANAASGAEVNSYVAQLIVYYRDYQEAAATDIERVLQELTAVDANKGAAWSRIMDYWRYVNTGLTINLGNAPDELPEDDSMCIVILGYALNGDGSMRSELIGRLETGLAAAEKYPNAFVVVTGGGTAANAPDVTEGQAMADWLMDNGLDEDRIIIEDAAPDTVGNARNTYNILHGKYPDVTSILMVTSDYHIRRGSVLFYSQFMLSAYEELSEPMEVISNAAYETGKATESVSTQASGVASVAGVSLSSVSVKLSQLISMSIAKASEDPTYTVLATYDTDYIRDVSALAEVSVEGDTVTVTYTENGTTLTAAFALDDESAEVSDNTYLRNLLEKVEDMSFAAYTKTSAERVTAALEAAEAVLAKEDATAEEIREAYDALNKTLDQLVTLTNIAYKKNVVANCNQKNAAKITDGSVVLSSSSFWASVDDNGKNIASANAEVVIDLDGLYHVECVRVYPYWDTTPKRIYKYEVYGSADGESWEKIGENMSDDYVTDAGVTHDTSADIAYLKIKGVSTKVVGRSDINNIHLIEVEAFGEEVNNLALKKPVTSSGTDTSASSSSGSSDAQVVDGNRESYWDAGLYSKRPWVIVDLEDLYDLEKINVITYWMRGDRYYTYEIAVSTDGENFTDLYIKEKTESELATIFGDTIELQEPVCARYVKLTGTYDSKNTSFHLCELRVYGEAHEHSFGDWDVTKEPTATETGTKERSCADCGYTETQTLPASGTDTLIGDLNRDGKVTAIDRVALTRYLAEWEGYTEETIDLAAADLDGDGIVTFFDRTVFARHIANWDGYIELPVKK